MAIEKLEGRALDAKLHELATGETTVFMRCVLGYGEGDKWHTTLLNKQGFEKLAEDGHAEEAPCAWVHEKDVPDLKRLYYWEPTPRYLDDDNALWRVVRRLTEGDDAEWGIGIRTPASGPWVGEKYDPRWSAMLFKKKDQMDAHSAYGDTVNTAICLAIVEALEGNDGN